MMKADTTKNVRTIAVLNRRTLFLEKMTISFFRRISVMKENIIRLSIEQHCHHHTHKKTKSKKGLQSEAFGFKQWK